MLTVPGIIDEEGQLHLEEKLLEKGKKGKVFVTLVEEISEALRSGFTWLSLSATHIEAYTQLPFFEQHRDPFDRMILAIALADNLTVISTDRNFPLHRDTINVLW